MEHYFVGMHSEQQYGDGFFILWRDEKMSYTTQFGKFIFPIILACSIKQKFYVDKFVNYLEYKIQSKFDFSHISHLLTQRCRQMFTN